MSLSTPAVSVTTSTLPAFPAKEDELPSANDIRLVLRKNMLALATNQDSRRLTLSHLLFELRGFKGAGGNILKNMSTRNKVFNPARLKEELGLNNELREDNSDILISSLVEKVFLRAEIIQKENNLKNICSGVVLAALLEVINEKPENPNDDEEIKPIK